MSLNLSSLPSPADPAPRSMPLVLRLGGRAQVTVRNDAYSDRIRCDHPDTKDGAALGTALLEAAQKNGRGRVVVLAHSRLRAGLLSCGFFHEATMPGFYCGTGDCDVLGFALDQNRQSLADAPKCEEVDRLIRERPAGKQRPPISTIRATVDDAREVAQLITATFEHYPTPSGVPAYLEESIRQGIPFRLVRMEGTLVACASADLVREAKTAELTDCATLPQARGGGFMQSILADLMDDLRQMGYPTAFTLARACIPGVNLAFQRLGFEYNGRMARSCRIGSGLEDMNVWSRRL